MNHFVVDGRYRELLEYHGIDAGEVLKYAGLPGDILSRKTITMSEAQYYRFMDAIQAVGSVPGLSVKLAASAQIEHFSPPVFAAYCSCDGIQCVQRLSRYKKLIGPMRMEAVCEGECVTVKYLPGDDTLRLPDFLAESEISFLVNILRRATRQRITPLGITLLSEPQDAALSEFAGVAAVTGDENSVSFALSDMERPFISCDEGLWEYFEPELNRRLSDLDVDDSVSARVRAALTELLPAGSCGIDDAAKALGLTRRTLQRKLTEENTTFQKQLNGTRELLALHYARSSGMSAGDIAFLLGYAELNSFLRAFAVWTGKSFSDYRKDKTIPV